MKEKLKTRVICGCLLTLVSIIEFYAIFSLFLDSRELCNKCIEKVDAIIHCDTISVTNDNN